MIGIIWMIRTSRMIGMIGMIRMRELLLSKGLLKSSDRLILRLLSIKSKDDESKGNSSKIHAASLRIACWQTPIFAPK